MNLYTNFLWTLVYLRNILTYQNNSDFMTQKGHIALFQISRQVSPKKNKTLLATHNPTIGIYEFDHKRFTSLNDMLFHVLYL